MPPFLRYLPRRVFMLVNTVLVTLLLAPPIILASVVISGGAAFRLMQCWAWLVSRGMGLKFSVRGGEQVVPGVSYIVTPNHQSNADILALIGTLPVRYRWVVKKELVRIPFFGWALARTGAISLDRSDPKRAVDSLQRGLDRLKGGWSMLIYPEGTRTPDGKLLPFKKGPFKLAVQTGLPILPVTTNGAFKVLPRDSIALRPGHIIVTIGDPITTEGLTEDDVPQLMEKTRQAIEARLDLDYDPFENNTRS